MHPLKSDPFLSSRDEELEYELGAAMGDPRRCPVHPNVTTSSPDGMFDAPCGACEYEMSVSAAKWEGDSANPQRSRCNNDPGRFRFAGLYPSYTARCDVDPNEIPF